MRLDSLHPGATVEDVRDTIGWDVAVAADLADDAGADRRGAAADPRGARPGRRLHEVARSARTTVGATGDHRAGPRDRRQPTMGPDGLACHATRIASSSATSTARRPLARSRRRGPRSAGPDLRVLDRESIPTGRLLAALSTALDLTEGQLPGPRAAHLPPRDAPGRRPRPPGGGPEALFIAAFLKDAGCSSNAAAVTRIFGADDIALKNRQSTTERSMLAYAAFTIRSLPSTEPLPRRLRRLIAIGVNGRREQREVEQLRCERGAAIARKAGFDDAVAGRDPRPPRALGRRRRAARPPRRRHPSAGPDPGRLPGPRHLREPAGRARGLEVLAARRGTWYDPDIADALLEACDARAARRARRAGPPRSDDARWSRPGSFGPRTTTTSTGSPAPSPTSSTPRARSPARTRCAWRRSPRSVAARLGLPARAVTDVRRAGLLHDLGKLGVPNTILDKPGRLDDAEMAVIRRHPGADPADPRPIPTFAPSPSSPPATTSASTVAATSAAWPRRTWRSAPGSSRSPTSSRRSPRTGRIERRCRPSRRWRPWRGWPATTSRPMSWRRWPRRSAEEASRSAPWTVRQGRRPRVSPWWGVHLELEGALVGDRDDETTDVRGHDLVVRERESRASRAPGWCRRRAAPRRGSRPTWSRRGGSGRRSG